MTTTYDWPGDPMWTPMSGSFRPMSLSTVSTSPYTGMQKASSLGQVWVAKLSWNPRELVDAHDIQAFLDQLEGAVNPVRMFDWWRQSPLLLSNGSSPWSDGTFWSDGTGWTDGYAPTIKAVGASGDKSVLLTGLPASVPCFRRGDLIGINGYLYELRAAAFSNAAGESLLLIQPGLRFGIAISDPVILFRPTCQMRMVSDPEMVRTFQWGEGFSLTFAEDVQ